MKVTILVKAIPDSEAGAMLDVLGQDLGHAHGNIWNDGWE
jgi:hypothetical protein